MTPFAPLRHGPLHMAKPWMFLTVAIVAGGVCLVSLRANNEGMIARREAVYAADKAGGDVEGALRELRAYVYGHMNTSLTSGANAVYPPIQLKYTYERKQAEQQAKLGQNNSTIYHEALAACEAAGNTSTGDTIACIERYAAARGIALAPIPDGLYKFDFTSAKWSPDVAGWSMLLSIGSFLAFLATAGRRWIRKRYGI